MESRINHKIKHVPDKEGVYVLKLAEGKYYVGYSKKMRTRISQHFEKEGSAWTRLYDVLCVSEFIEGAGQDEEMYITLKTMRIHGWKNVRGGRWCQVEMPNPPEELSDKMVCYNCGGEHSIKYCDKKRKTPYPPPPKKQKVNVCFRCGRESHLAYDCYATKDVDGRIIKD